MIVEKKSVLLEMERLSKQVRNSTDFSAFCFCFDSMIKAYNAAFNADYYVDRNKILEIDEGSD